MSGDPPVEEGAVHERVTCALPDVAVRPVGALGTVIRYVRLTKFRIGVYVPLDVNAAL